MKRITGLAVVLFLAVMGRTFAQFTMDAAVSTAFDGITPSIGIGGEFSKLDLLAGVSLSIFIDDYEYENTNINSYVYRDNNGGDIGIYAGLAPKVPLSGKWALSFPLLVQLWSSETITTDYSTDSHFSIGFRAGARAAYAFSNNWSLYTGFLVNMVSWGQTEYYRWGDKLEDTHSRLNVFNDGVIQLGIICKFGSSKNTTRAAPSAKADEDDWW
jgi:hypothetical protein